MKYLEKSFTLPTSQGITQEQWDAIWSDKSDGGYTDGPGRYIERAMPSATVSETLRADSVALGFAIEPSNFAMCSNCHAHLNSYRHTETCVTPHEED